MTDRRRRYYRAIRAGAHALNMERWTKLVDDAETAVSAAHRDHVFDPAVDYAKREWRHATFQPTDFVISAQTILDIEAALAIGAELVAEAESLAKDDLDSARRARLVLAIERAIENVGRRLRGAST